MLLVNALADKYQKLSDSKLQDQTKALKKRLEKETLDKILPDAFALVREVATRVLVDLEAYADDNGVTLHHVGSNRSEVLARGEETL